MEYTFKITPDVRNMASEGSLDTSVLNGVSCQRTLNVLDVVDSSGNRKQINVVKDGNSFDDTVAGIEDNGDSDG
jgi:hypothetical protein